MRLKVNTTSSALKSRDGVKYAVVWNFTPRRRWKVYTRPSAEISQLSASAGATEVSPLTNSTSRLYSGSAASLSVAVVYCAVSNPAGLPSEQNTRLFLSAAWPIVATASRLVPKIADRTVVWRMTIPILVCSCHQRAITPAYGQGDITDPTHSKCPSDWSLCCPTTLGVEDFAVNAQNLTDLVGNGAANRSSLP